MATKQEMIDSITDVLANPSITADDFNEYHRRLRLVLELSEEVK